MTIGFALLSGVERLALDWLMVGGLAALLGALLFVAVILNYPFTGDVSVTPEPFDRLVDFAGPGPSDGGGD